MSSSAKMARQTWLTCSLLVACSSMQNLGEKAGIGGGPGEPSATIGGGSGSQPIGVGEISGSGGLVEPVVGGASFSWSGAGIAGTLQGGTGNTAAPNWVNGGSAGIWDNGDCWGIPDVSTAQMACPATYCELRAQMVGYCGNYVSNRQPPIVRYAYQRRCGAVKDVVVSVAAYGYSCRYQGNALVGLMDYSDKNDFCAGRSTDIQSGVSLTDCSSGSITFCDARMGAGGAAGSSASSFAGARPMAGSAGRTYLNVAGFAGVPTSNVAGAFSGGGTSGVAGTTFTGGQAGAAGTQSSNIGLCYDAATDTCQPC